MSGNNKSNLVPATDRVVSSTDNMPLEDTFDLKRTFESADRDALQSAKLGLSAEQQAAVVVLAFYAQRYPSDTGLWKLDARAGKGVFEQERYNAFRSELRTALGMQRPTVAQGSSKNEAFIRLDDAYNRRDKLLTRGMAFAVDLTMTPDIGSRHSAGYVLTWYDRKSHMFSVPYSKLMKRGQFPTGEIGMKVNGYTSGGKTVEPDPDLFIVLDNRRYSAMGEGGEDFFNANAMRIRECAASHRVEQQQITTVDPKTGKRATATVETPIAPVAQRSRQSSNTLQTGIAASPPTQTGAVIGRPPGASNEQPAQGELGLGDLMKQMVRIMSEPADAKADIKDRFWSNHPMRDDLNNLITMLMTYRANAISFEVKARAEMKLPPATFNRAELITQVAEPNKPAPVSANGNGKGNGKNAKAG